MDGLDQSAGGHGFRLAYRPPYDWPAMLRFLRARAVAGVERVGEAGYRRTVRHGEALGTVEIALVPDDASLSVILRDSCAAPAVATNIRRVFDLDADVAAIGAHLGRDPLLAPLVAARPGLRVPGGWDGFELAVRAVLGQQISVAAARRLAGALARLCGTALAAEASGDPDLTLAFPTAAQLAAADLGALGMPRARKAALAALAEAAAGDPALFSSRGTIEATVAGLRAIAGIGEWTAQYIALRAVREADAFPASDAGLLRGAALLLGERPSPAALLRRAEAWRPYRAYAAQHLWEADAAAGLAAEERSHA